MGRPQKPTGEARDRLMQIRLQPTEYEVFREAAESAGLDLSAWVRERLRQIARRELGEHGKVATFTVKKKSPRK